MTNRKVISSQKSKDTVKCECGEEIILLSDEKAMGEAIEAHVAVHLETLKDNERKSTKAESLRDSLIAQVFAKAIQLQNDESNR